MKSKVKCSMNILSQEKKMPDFSLKRCEQKYHEIYEKVTKIFDISAVPAYDL